MKVPEAVRRCVAFVAYDTVEGRRLAGTAFFAGEDLPGTNVSIIWLVTAAHVINGIDAKGLDHQVYVRLNNVGGGTTWLGSNCNQFPSLPHSRAVG
jgi:hypothetical protein